MKITIFLNHWDYLLLCERNPPRLVIKSYYELEDDPLSVPFTPKKLETSRDEFFELD